MRIRPWGQLDWLTGKLGSRRWGLLGTASVEERCLAVFDEGHASPDDTRFISIVDPEPSDPVAFRELLDRRRAQLVASGVPPAQIPDARLLASIDDVVEHCDFLPSAGITDVILDISAMPKRWFFLAIQRYLADDMVRNLIVTYTAARRYGETLAENPDPLRMLPGFPGDSRGDYDAVVVGIGFEPLGLTSLLRDFSVEKIKLLFPFPPGPPGVARNWNFVKTIEEMIFDQAINPPDRVHVHMYDCPQIFDAIGDMSDFGRKRIVLAPYGPKTVSLSMCLFAIAAKLAGRPMVPLYYAQPKRYAIDYSTGVKMEGEKVNIHAYCLKLDGINLYKLP